MNSPKITNILLLVLLVFTLITVGSLSYLQGEKTNSYPTNYQRFLPIPTETAGIYGVPSANHFALDTATGQLCKTFPWNIPDNSFNQIPLCRDLLGR